MSTLCVGYVASDFAGRRGAANRAALPSEVTFFVFDIYQKHALEHTLPGAEVICAAHLPAGDWEKIRFKTGPKRMAGELALSALQEIHLLKPHRFTLDWDGRERDKNEFLDKIRLDPSRVRDFGAMWPASVPNGPKLMFKSYPGCFCHRRLDEGGLALAEVVSRELATREHSAEPLRILDMGCGCGLVSCLIASVVPNTALTLIDSHARAVEAAMENVKSFGYDAEVVLADDGIAALKNAKHRFDVFVGNPPYYSDYRIADLFLDTAKKALKWGGVCYTVCKNAAGLEPIQKRYFPEVEIIRRRGYAVLKSVHKEEQ